MSNERQRQIEEEKWTPEHDDEHGQGELADAAAWYATAQHSFSMFSLKEIWDPKWFKKEKHDRKKQLIIAGALLIAELERLERLENKDVQ